jgi:D-alanyl-D-alanine carboxypeptidase
MHNSYFVEPSGVNPKNQSTAMDVAILLREALKNDLIKDALTTQYYSFDVMGGKRYIITNTNELLGSYLDIEGGKTGYIDEAGFCLVNLVKSEQAREGIVVVILGADSKEQRFQENKFLSQWVFDNWVWKEAINNK